ncbi:LTA synthase family protein [Runella sp.]|uniref:LTA synthase family protein n=1 Tax=Runella sp. TaxID=1960881 RepID=UPI003D111D78
MFKDFTGSLSGLSLYAVTFRRIAVVMFIFTLTRLLFFWYNHSYYSDVRSSELFTMLLGGLRFDTTAVLYTNLLYLFLYILPFSFRYNLRFQTFQKWQYMLLNSIAILANCMDTVYFQFVKRRMSFTILTEFRSEVKVGTILLGGFLNFWHITLVLITLIASLYFTYGKPIPKPLRSTKPAASFGIQLTLMLLISGLIVAGLRGGFTESTRPITLSNAGEYCKKPLEMAIVLNTPFSIYKTIETNDLEEVHQFKDQAELEKLFNPIHQPDTSKAFQPLNVVLIVLESFSYEYVGIYNKELDGGKYRGYTPFLDSLIGESKTFWYSFANGEKSIDALPSATTSLPYIKEPYVTFPYAASNTLNSMASLLKPEGYQTAFFHGAPNGSMGFWAFLRQVGYDQYFGKNEYNNDADFDGVWGIWDEPFLQFMAKKINTMKPPFITTCFTLSSHDPNKVPAQYEGKFPKGTVAVHQCIGYSDMALRKFFQTASQMPWFKNTLFVLTADHTNQAHFPEYMTDAGIYRIPIIFYQPGSALKGMDKDRMMQQIDIMPTVLNYLHYPKPYVAFGKDAFDASGEDWAFNYNNGTYQYFNRNYLLQYRDGKTVGMFDFKKDVMLKQNLMGKLPAVQHELENRLLAFLQQYTHRVIHDEMTISKLH